MDISFTWLPIRVDIQTQQIHWMDFGTTLLTEPFMHESVQRLTSENPKAKARLSTYRSLAKIEEDISPSGFIFHISRCGSTLLSNALRALPDTIVISEPQPIKALLLSNALPTEGTGTQQSDEHYEALKGIVRAYGQRRTGSEKALVIKFSSWSLLYLAIIRKLWPQAPSVIIVRDPAEVMVSCLEEAPEWMNWKKYAAALLGLSVEAVLTMSDHTFCARMIGAFLRCAEAEIDDGCVVIDYANLTQAAVESVAQIFGIAVTDEGREAIRASFSVYSKDPRGKRKFSDDREAKRSRITDALRSEVDEWARGSYESLQMEGSLLIA